MFGGTDGTSVFDERWSYQDKTWTPLEAASLPQAPIGPAMAYDAARGELVAFGGTASLIDAIREYGHLAVQIDPLGTAPPGAVELRPESHGITEEDLTPALSSCRSA